MIDCSIRAMTGRFQKSMRTMPPVVQLARTGPMSSRGLPVLGVQQWRSVHYPIHCRTLHATPSTHPAFTLDSLPPGYSYTGPSGSDNDDICKCNSVVYNLMSACDACQGSPWLSCVYSFWQSPCILNADTYQRVISYSRWMYNCTRIADVGT